jgi:membrane protein required for colicin V production
VNALDLAILGVIALSAVFAFARGFVREALSLVAWAGAAAVAFYGFHDVSAMIGHFVSMPLLPQLIAGAGLFLISLIVLTIVTWRIARFVHSTALSPIDRTLGLIFGVARGILLLSIAYLALNIILPREDWPAPIQASKSLPFFAGAAEMLRPMLPEVVRAKVGGAAEEARRTLNQAQEAQRAMGALSVPGKSPTPRTDQSPAPAQKPGQQGGQDQRGLTRLFGTVQQQPGER